MYWLYYEMKKYDNYTDAERIQLWALGTFYYDTLGHQWHNKENWMTDKKGVTVCDWYGLTCDADGMVVLLQFVGMLVVEGRGRCAGYE